MQGFVKQVHTELANDYNNALIEAANIENHIADYSIYSETVERTGIDFKIIPAS